MKKSRFSDAQIIGALQEHEKGAKVPELCHKHGITEPTFAPLLPSLAGTLWVIAKNVFRTIDRICGHLSVNPADRRAAG